VAVLGDRRFLHPGPVAAAALSPNGKTLVSVDGRNDYLLCVWEAGTGKEVRRLRGHQNAVNQFAFSPDSKTLYSGGGAGALSPFGPPRAVRAWELATGRLVRTVPAHFWALSSDGKTLAVTDLLPGKVEEHAGPKGELHLAPGPAGFRVALWDTASWKERGGPRVEKRLPAALAFSPDGRALACGDSQDGSIRLWDVRSGKELRTIAGPRGAVHLLAFSPDGKSLASASEEPIPASRDKAIDVWDTGTGKRKGRLSGHVGRIAGLAFTPDGAHLISAGPLTPADPLGPKPPGGKCWLWDLARGKAVRALGPKDLMVTRCTLSPDGKALVLTGTSRHNVFRARLLDLKSGEEVLPPEPKPGQSIRLPFPVQGPFLQPREMIQAQRLDGGRTFRLDISEGTVRLLDSGTGKELRRFRGEHVNHFDCSPDGKTLATRGHRRKVGYNVDDAAVRLWDVEKGTEWGRIATRPAPDWTIRFSPDGRSLAVVHADGVVRLWEVASGKERLALDGQRETLLHLAFSRDGRRLAGGNYSRNTVLVWDLTGGPARPGPAALEALWADLQGADAKKAYRAVWALAGAPAQAVPFLDKKARGVRPLDRGRVPALIADLGGDSFERRERATEELVPFGLWAAVAVREKLAQRPDLETRRRLERLLPRLEANLSPPALIGALRAVEALEQCRTPDARRVLAGLAKAGPPQFVEAARAALERLSR
jgi:WD40 repeat protein